MTLSKAPPAPKPSEVGYTAAVASNAEAAFNDPAPACCTPSCTVPDLTAVEELIRSDRYCTAVKPGLADFNSAAAPATVGAEKLVPPTRA